jgi:transposase
MRSKELSVELRDRIVSRHRSGEGYQKMATALKVHKNTVASIILKWKRASKSWPPSQTEESGEKALGQGGDQEPDGH